MLEKINSFGLLGTLKELKNNVSGIKSASLAHSYQLATFVIVFNLIAYYVLLIMAGVLGNQFVLYVDTMKDFALPLSTGAITFCTIAITTCLGATYIDNKKPKEEKSENNQ